MASGLRWSGTGDLRGLSVRLTGSSERVGARAATVVRTVSSLIVRDAKLFAPVDTGYLRSSIGDEILGDGHSGRITAIIGPTADYGIYQELGTSRMPPNPFLFPAFDRHTGSIEDALLASVGDIG